MQGVIGGLCGSHWGLPMVTVSYAESGGIVSVSSTLDSMMNYVHSTVC